MSKKMNRLRDNWYQTWQLGRFELEIEWVPRGHYYMFTFSINSTQKQLARINEKTKPHVKHGVGRVVETRDRPPFVIDERE